MKAATPASGKIRMITMAEVEKHSTKESVWFVRGGKARHLNTPVCFAWRHCDCWHGGDLKDRA